MGLWLKKDGEFIPVSGGGSGGGSFDGEHVPTGDPTDPAMFEALDVGQLLYDGVESDGSDGGPHNHDYLPLTGGTVTGDLTVDGNVAFKISSSNTPGYGLGQLKAGNGASLRIYSEGDANYANRILVHASIFDMASGCLLLVRDGAEVKGDLTVGGTATVGGKTVATTDQVQNLEYWDYEIPDANADGNVHQEKISWPGTAHLNGGALVSVVGRGAPNNGLIVESWGHSSWGGSGIEVKYRTKHGVEPRRGILRFWSLTNFGVSRADNEVVTALLAKVKEQSEQIATLSADIQELKGN